MNKTDRLKHIVASLPEKPGIYRFIDRSGSVLYIGKAKNLKKRVLSYFSGNQTGKTMVLIGKTVDIEHFVVDTESDALLLENNLIKKYQPKYNVLLKDDKTFPWLCIRNEPFPRIILTRRNIKDGSQYFGPYTSVRMVNTLVEMIRKLYRLRSCSLSLTESNISSGKFKVCLEYHLGNCNGPCAGYQTEEDYRDNIEQIKDILKGKISSVIGYLRRQMKLYSENLRFEEAQKVKEKIEILSGFKSSSAVVSNTIRNVDVFAFTEETGNAFVGYLKVIQGAVIQAFTLSIKPGVDEDKKSILDFAVTEIRQRFKSDSGEIIVPFRPDLQIEGIRYTVPRAGDKLKLLKLAERNAVYYMMEQKKSGIKHKPQQRTLRNLERIKNDLNLPVLPVHMECFDNSNIMGTNPVASCVVFRDAKPSRKEYRHFNIKTVKGPDDFSSIEEIIFRRFSRLMTEEKKLPQLIVIDGGKGQLSSAVKSLKRLGLEDKVAVIGIAKRLEEIYFPGDSVPLYLDKNSKSLKIIQHLRDEAHRFGIGFHRDKRSSEMVKSDLDSRKGIGSRTKETLLKHFGSVNNVKRASFTDLEKIIGTHKAGLISGHYSR